MDMNIINSFLFHTRKSFQEMGDKDMLIEVAKDVKVGIRFHLIDESSPTLLFFHGNGEIVTDYADIVQMYNQTNINFIIASYRRYGFSTGSPNAPNT